ncbi:hypothetical protein KP509_14G006100 [Ceratopteris richardii]|uniref:Pentatricopeptide repeat-containing protein n=1 Tax=Ceratopteris richardii TaxID=49495 RepID=A0A8T2T783_CERRI|nr:hypothetical protein KP509_14G006100 [Ceratopteris richardii]KAH7414691.1 hypothetical protein KP509_14G006100 [Ceratopteris richardii]KAH7414692.1 hypothetical protein KP509_14G006100 [Ceratopteris richardii]
MRSAWSQQACLPRGVVVKSQGNYSQLVSRRRSRPSSTNLKVLFLIEQGVLPQLSIQDIAYILQTCKRNQDYHLSIRLHSYMQRNNLDTHPLLGNYLVPMLVDVGCIREAQQVFDRLVHVNEWSWDSLIWGYVNHGKLQHALSLYAKMPKDDSIHPLGRTFVSLLRACAKLKNLKSGLEIHADVSKRGLIQKDPFIGSSLIDLYAKCGFLAKAQEVFNGLLVKDVVCWTALVSGYAEHGSPEEALYHFKQMRLQNIVPDAVTFVCALKACANLSAEADGEELHIELERLGLLYINVILGNALVDMYTKSGSMRRAHEVLDKLPNRNVISWTTLISGYVEGGYGQEALICYEQMLRDGIFPNSITYTCILKNCGNIGALEKGYQIHSIIVFLGLFTEDLLVGNGLVDMYANVGAFHQALVAFEKLSVRNSVTWATVILCCTEQGEGEKALELYHHMQLEGVIPDTITFICGLKSCAITGAIDKGREIHVELERQGLVAGNVFVGNTLVDMYAKCGALALAREVLNSLRVKDVVSWTALLSGYVDHGLFEDALEGFEQMQLAGIPPNVVTYVCALKACSIAKATDIGQQIHADIAKDGSLERDPAIGNMLIDVYAKGGLLVSAQEVFDRLPMRTIVSWATLILGYAENGCGEEAINLFEQMQIDGHAPDSATLICVLKACCTVGALDKGREIHAEIERQGLLEKELVGNMLITMYANAGLLVQAQQVFDRLPIQDVVSWTALMAGYAQVGDSESVFYAYNSMLRNGLAPDPVTFVVVLNACSRMGFVNMSQTLFEKMSKEHGMTPTLDHHICLINSFVRVGHLKEGEAMIRHIPECYNSGMWNAVLNSCKSWGDVEFARWAFAFAAPDGNKNAVAHVVVSNAAPNGSKKSVAHVAVSNVDVNCHIGGNSNGSLPIM